MQDPVIAYTDGACSGNPGPAGAGALIRIGGVVWELSEHLGHGTNNIAELTAILRAAERIAEVHPNIPAVIHTDSTYAIGVLSKGWNAKANQALIRETKAALAALSDWSLKHVRGHAGIPDNEYADRLATTAVRTATTTPWQQAPDA